MSTLDTITPYLLNPYSGTMLLVIAIGYVVRAAPFIANRFIPLIGICSGAVFFLIVAPLTMKADSEHAWNWYVMLLGVGFILSAAAWLIHLLVISRMEDYLRTKFPGLDDWFKNTSDQPGNQPKV